MRLGAAYLAQFADGRFFFFFMGVRPVSCRIALSPGWTETGRLGVEYRFRTI